jgi:hypothetical protein
MQVKKALITNVTYQIHAGNSSIWSTPWLPIWESIHLYLLQPVTVTPLPETVSDLWLLHSQKWNFNLLNDIFDTQVTNLQTVPKQSQDVLRWMPAKKVIVLQKYLYSSCRTKQNSIACSRVEEYSTTS